MHTRCENETYEKPTIDAVCDVVCAAAIKWLDDLLLVRERERYQKHIIKFIDVCCERMKYYIRHMCDVCIFLFILLSTCVIWFGYF